jgi:hypothetical protein
MKPRELLTAAFAIAVFALNYLSPEKLCAQEEGENSNSPPIEMVINPNTSEEMWQTSHDGLLDPVGMYPAAQMAIILRSPSVKAGGPVGIAPLDGGNIIADRDLQVAEDGTIAFTFEAGTTPGMYRVAVMFGMQPYQLQLYVARPADFALNCNPP